MKYLFQLIVLMGISLSINAQEWMTDSSKLYYLTKHGKVFIEPDYSAAAIYFNEGLSEAKEHAIIERLKLMKTGGQSDASNIEVMNLKGIVRLKSTSGLNPIRSSKNRKDFLDFYELANDGAYEVLPAFTVDGIQAWMTKRVVIRVKEGYNLNSISNIMDEFNGTYIKNLTDTNTFIIEVKTIGNQLKMIQKIDAQGMLDWGEPDFKMELKKFNDPLYPEQWHLNNTGGTLDGKALVNDIDIDAPEAWTIATGNNVTVAVLDDGMDNHEDLATLLTGFTPGVTSGEGSAGFPEYSNTLSPPGHGQSCGGLIGAIHNDIGVKGVAPDVSMFSINIFHSSVTNSDIATGINWAVNSGADVLSNSWGYPTCTGSISSITAAFDSAAVNGRSGLGCIILVAAGNSYSSCVSYPADIPSVMAVGAISGDGQRSVYSQYGPALDIVAPSDDDPEFDAFGNYIGSKHGLRTIDLSGSAGYEPGNYNPGFGGTSGATPIAAGVAALVLSVDPTLTKTEVENILYTTAVDVGNSNEYGNGMVNAYQAVLAASASSDTQAPTTPTGLSSSNVAATSFDISWNASTDNTGVAGYNIYVDGSNVGTSATTSYTVAGLSPNTSYTVSVSAYDAANNESGQSSAISVSTTVATISCSTTISSYPYSEGFESNDGWTQIGGDDGNWVRNSGVTPSSNTGPSSASEGTFYMFLEASSNNSPGEIGSNATAILESDCFDLSGESSATFSFENHMYGTDVGSLAVQVSVDDLNWTTAWSQSGNQGNQWNAVDVDLSSYVGNNIKLRIVGTTGNGWSSDIAVDNMSMTTNGNASDTEAPTNPTSLVSSNITQTAFDISWNASTDNVGVVQYNIYINGSNIGSVTGTQASITSVSAATTYAVAVEAQDAAGNVSGQTSINVTTADASGSTIISEGYFETGLDGWTLGGGDASWISNSTRSCENTSSIRLRDNNGVSSSMTSESFDLSGYNSVDIEFLFYPNSMETGEDFFLQYNDGSGWQTIETYASGTDFSNNSCYTDTQTISASNGYSLTNGAQFRFQCDAGARNDRVYIDAVIITGSGSASSSSPNTLNNNPTSAITQNAKTLSIYPNPATTVLNIKSNGYKINSIKVFSIIGELVLEANEMENSSIDISNLPSGNYILRAISESEVLTKRFIKK
ncbi:MAG: S8 family serine peptidase [Bacteroidota bacterium]